MKNIAPGLSLKKYKGNKHEQGGIMVNALGNKTKDITKAVAEVEGGEYSYRSNPNNPKGPYIISAQLGTAEIAKQANTFKNNDRISYNTRNNLLNKSVKLNEILKAQQEQSQMQQAALGGMLKKYRNGGNPMLKIDKKSLAGDNSYLDKKFTTQNYIDYFQEKADKLSRNNAGISDKLDFSLRKFFNTPENYNFNPTNPVENVNTNQNPLEIKLGKNLNPSIETKQTELPKLPVTTPKTTTEAANTGMQVNTKTNTTPEPTINKKGVKDVTSGLSGIASAFGPIGQAVGAGIQLAPYAVDLGKAMFDKTAVQDLQTQGSAMRLPNTKYAKHGGKLNIKPLPKYDDGTQLPSETPSVVNKNPSISELSGVPLQIQQSSGLVDFAGRTTYNNPAIFNQDNLERMKDYDTSGISNALKTFYPNQGLTPGGKSLNVVETPKQKDKLSEMLKSGLMLKGSAMAGSLFSALQPAQKETLRLPDFGRADAAMSKATGFSMNPALNEVEQARGKSQEAIRNMATTAGQLTSNLQSVNQRAGQQAAGLKVQEQQIMNQLAAQRAGYETQKASAIQQELARFDENTMMNKAATQDARVAFVENINNLGTEIMKQGNEQDIANEQDKLAVQNAKLKIIQSAFENPDVISGNNLEQILKMIEKGDYTNIPKLFGQPSDTRRIIKEEEARQAASKK